MKEWFLLKLKCSWETSYIYVKDRYLYEFFTDSTVLYFIFFELSILHIVYITCTNDHVNITTDRSYTYQK